MIQGKREESLLKRRREGLELVEAAEAVVPEVVLQV